MHLDDHVLLDYHLGQLDDDHALKISSHLADCAGCAERLEHLG